MGVLIGVLTAIYVLSIVFLVFIVLIQKGKGGGLAGVFGGGGGTSMFGVKAGDVLGKITAAAAIIFIVLAVLLSKLYGLKKEGVTSKGDRVGTGAPVTPGPVLPEGPIVPTPGTTDVTPAPPPATTTPATPAPAKPAPKGGGEAPAKAAEDKTGKP